MGRYWRGSSLWMRNVRRYASLCEYGYQPDIPTYKCFDQIKSLFIHHVDIYPVCQTPRQSSLPSLPFYIHTDIRKVHVHTRYDTTPLPFSSSISVGLSPNTSVRTSSVCWPSIGGAILTLVWPPSLNFTGGPTNFTLPHPSWCTSTTIFLAWTCGCSNVSLTSLIAAYGIPLPSKIANHCAVVFVIVTLSMAASSSTRLVTRALFVAKRGLRFHSGCCKRSQITPKSRSLPPPSMMSPSEVLNPLYGAMLGCAVPQRPVSRSPEIRTELAMLLSVATWQSERATSRCWPRLVFARPRRAAMIALEVYRPVVRSVTATPTLTGGPVRSPVMCIRPNSASTITS